MKGSSSRMKNKMGAQMGAFIKMKQEKGYVYQLFYVVCYVPIITIFFRKIIKLLLQCFALFSTNVHFCAL
ncbi:Uncharacterised protein [Serratia rubidaea]|uniref:Uncharacterized protein n=1 Tax=Serratia rubidaea TaxID=61652 RepID=A0A3S5F135_SERRU|nr:Uncharacterised protein [Serratia rubidaea]